MTAWFFFSGFFGTSTPIWAATSEETAFRRLYFGLQQPIDRDAERLIELVIELLDDGRVSEAAPLIEARLAARSDHLSTDGRSLKALLTETLGELSPSQLRRLQSVLSASHGKRLTAAKTTSDWRRLAAQSPATLYGVEALAGLARAEEDAGAYRAADRAYRAATAAGGSGSQMRSWLAERSATNRLRLNVESTGDPATSTAERVSRPDRAPTVWCGAGGDATRRGLGEAALPRRWCDWSVEFPSPDRDQESPDDPPQQLASGSTVAAAGVLVTRTVGGLVAIDSRSGKRVWRCEVRPDRQIGLSAVERGLSSDGRRVYAVTANPSTNRAEAFGMNPRFRGRVEQDATNALVAFDLPRQGKVVWRLDGGTADGPLAGARFLGPPAADEGRLYALVDLRQVISLVEIDARTGSIEWIQPLAGRPNGRGAEAAVSPVSPTVGEDRVYCPTGAGAVVAVDPLRRRLAWTHYLSVSKATARRAKSRGWRRNAWNNAVDAWRHARVVEQSGTLTVVSPAATLVETLDAQTGRSLWSHYHKQGRLLAAVTPDLVVLVERGRVVARDRTSGQRAWSARLPSDDPLAGEGLLLGDRCLVPLVSGQLAAIPIRNKSREAPCELIRFDLNPLEGPPALGDLLCYQGAIYSRSGRSLTRLRPGGEPLDVFDQAIDSLQRNEIARVKELLAPSRKANPADLAVAEVLAAAALQPSSNRGNPLDYASGPRAAAHGTLLRLTASLDEGDRQRAAELVERSSQAAYRGIVMTPAPGWEVTADRLIRGRFVTAAAERGWSVTPAGNNPREAPRDHPAATNPDWSLRQIEARVVEEATQPVQRRSSSRRRPRSNRQAQLEVSQPESAGGPVHWRLEVHRNGASLIGMDRWGDPEFVVPLPSAFRSPPRPPSLASDRRPQAMRWGDRIAVPLEGVTAVLGVAGNALAWTTESGDRHEIETPVAIGPWGVITKKERHLTCRRLEGGEIAWERHFEEGRSLYPRVLSSGDELFVATNRREGVRLSAWSGEESPEEWAPPRPLLWGSQTGKNLYVVDGAGSRELLVLRIDQPQQPLLRVAVEAGSHLAAVEDGGGLVAILSEELELTIVDVLSATVRFRRTLAGPPDSAVRSLRVRKRADRLLVEVDRSNPAAYRREGFSPVDATPLLTGELHCLDAEAGTPLWAHPAEVSAMSLLAPQADCPLLLLARRKSPAPASSQGEATLSLVALDPATGSTTYRNHAVPAGDESLGERPLRVQRELGSSDRLTVRLGRTVITLTPEGPPAPPRPPYLARVEDPLGDQAEQRDHLPPAASQFFERLLGD